MKIVLIGGTGLIGSKTAARLRDGARLGKIGFADWFRLSQQSR